MPKRDFEADIRIVIRVPFKAAGDTEADRVAAAQHAEQELVGKLRRALGRHGEILAEVVEEVRER